MPRFAPINHTTLGQEEVTCEVCLETTRDAVMDLDKQEVLCQRCKAVRICQIEYDRDSVENLKANEVREEYPDRNDW